MLSPLLQKYLSKDNAIFGLLLGIILPLTVFGLLFGLEALIVKLSNMEQLMERSTMILVSIFVNLFSMRYFLVSRKCDKTGRGILMATFVLAMVFFLFLIDL